MGQRAAGGSGTALSRRSGSLAAVVCLKATLRARRGRPGDEGLCFLSQNAHFSRKPRWKHCGKMLWGSLTVVHPDLVHDVNAIYTEK